MHPVVYIVFPKPVIFPQDQYCRVPHVEDGVNQEDGPRPIDDEQTPLLFTIGQRKNIFLSNQGLCC